MSPSAALELTVSADWSLASRIYNIRRKEHSICHPCATICQPCATVATALVFATLNLGALVVETAGLSFVGLGAQPPTADWGTMLADGRQFMMTAPHVAAIPRLAVLALVWGLNIVGDGLRDVLEPRLAHTTR